MPQDIKFVAKPVAAHRLILTAEAEVEGRLAESLSTRCWRPCSSLCRYKRRGRRPGPSPEATPPAVPDAVRAPAPPAAPAGHLRSLEITPAGRTVAAAAVVTYAVGVVLGYDQLLVLASAGVLVLAAATVFIAWRPRVEVTREFRPSSVTAGQAAAAVLTVNNLSRWPSPPIRVADRLSHQDIELPIRVLVPAGSALVRYPLPTLRRGRVALGPLRVLRSDPFDLLRRRQPGGGLDVLWVHPRTWPLSPLPAGVIVDFEGPISETGTEGSLTFSSLRSTSRATIGARSTGNRRPGWAGSSSVATWTPTSRGPPSCWTPAPTHGTTRPLRPASRWPRRPSGRSVAPAIRSSCGSSANAATTRGWRERPARPTGWPRWSENRPPPPPACTPCSSRATRAGRWWS